MEKCLSCQILKYVYLSAFHHETNHTYSSVQHPLYYNVLRLMACFYLSSYSGMLCMLLYYGCCHASGPAPILDKKPVLFHPSRSHLAYITKHQVDKTHQPQEPNDQVFDSLESWFLARMFFEENVKLLLSPWRHLPCRTTAPLILAITTDFVHTGRQCSLGQHLLSDVWPWTSDDIETGHCFSKKTLILVITFLFVVWFRLCLHTVFPNGRL